MEFNNCINYLLTIAQHAVFVQTSEKLAKYDITPGQYGVLNYLWENGDATPKDLAAALALENSTVSGVLDRMQKKGLIDRRIDEEDRRSVRIALTPKGAALKKDVLQAIEEMNEAVLGAFDKKTAQTLLAALRVIGKSGG
ncbi:MAG: MarR family transcriptional regulator [Clostridiales Family XIII bacterium]|jgi:DNA-binding MarR family transcriptional regulator|nr:MarR family transcriptional regulator [Clostridiales Family XIII bacterium]